MSFEAQKQRSLKIYTDMVSEADHYWRASAAGAGLTASGFTEVLLSLTKNKKVSYEVLQLDPSVTIDDLNDIDKKVKKRN